jgi:hypothetical protein
MPRRGRLRPDNLLRRRQHRLRRQLFHRQLRLLCILVRAHPLPLTNAMGESAADIFSPSDPAVSTASEAPRERRARTIATNARAASVWARSRVRAAMPRRRPLLFTRGGSEGGDCSLRGAGVYTHAAGSHSKFLHVAFLHIHLICVSATIVSAFTYMSGKVDCCMHDSANVEF